MEDAFEKLAGVCSELKTKIDYVDSSAYIINGTSKITVWGWGRKFHARVIKDWSEIKIEVYNLGRLTEDRFVKELYKTIRQYVICSPLQIDRVAQISHAIKEDDEYFSGDERSARNEESGTPLPGEGAPSMEADIQDPDPNKQVLPSDEKICDKCGAVNEPGSRFCSSCGYGLAACTKCGYLPQEESTFCIKCGARLK